MATDKSQSTYDEIAAGLGAALPDFEVFHNQLLIGIYMKGTTKVLPGGQTLYVPQKTADEDKWQGKVGVVLKKGPMAFNSDSGAQFFGQDVNIGEWVVYRISDGFPIDINGVHCKIVEDVHIRGSVKDPTTIY